MGMKETVISGQNAEHTYYIPKPALTPELGAGMSQIAGPHTPATPSFAPQLPPLQSATTGAIKSSRPMYFHHAMAPYGQEFYEVYNK